MAWLGWERIQLALRVFSDDGSKVDPAVLYLQEARAPHRAVIPTRASADDLGALVHFNVMQGPGQAPLPEGDWLLLSNPSTFRREGPVSADESLLLERGDSVGRFRLSMGEYRVAPRRDASGSLALNVTFDKAIPGFNEGMSPIHLLTSRALRALGRLVFGLAYRLSRATSRRRERVIVFTSDFGDVLTGNLKVVFERMGQRGLDQEFDLRAVFRGRGAAGTSVRRTLRLAWSLGRADTVVIDDYQPAASNLDSHVRVVQLWHAVGAFKTVGYSRVGKPGAPNPYSRVHKNYTYAIVSSHYDVPSYAEAFGIPEGRVIPTGIPRVDRFLDLSRREGARQAALALFPEARGRTTVLFAPTFRGDGARTATYDFDRLDFGALHALCVEKDAVCIIRMHPFVRQPLEIPTRLRDRLLDGSSAALDVNDLLFAVDLLVTDYSSIVFEYSTLGRPMLFYAYDLEEYVAGRDFYEPYEEFAPGRIVRTFDELLDAIRREDYQLEKVAPFARRHFDHVDGRSTDRVIDLIIGR